WVSLPAIWLLSRRVTTSVRSTLGASAARACEPGPAARPRQRLRPRASDQIGRRGSVGHICADLLGGPPFTAATGRVSRQTPKGRPRLPGDGHAAVKNPSPRPAAV